MAFKLEDYMEQVEKWFRKYEMYNNKTKRQIYLATDDAEVVRLVNPITYGGGSLRPGSPLTPF